VRTIHDELHATNLFSVYSGLQNTIKHPKNPCAHQYPKQQGSHSWCGVIGETALWLCLEIQLASSVSRCTCDTGTLLPTETLSSLFCVAHRSSSCAEAKSCNSFTNNLSQQRKMNRPKLRPTLSRKVKYWGIAPKAQKKLGKEARRGSHDLRRLVGK
jgi:hypothetical protein